MVRLIDFSVMVPALGVVWCGRSAAETRSPAQKPAHKDLGRNGQARAITPQAAYAPVSNRAGSRSLIDLRCQIFILKQVMIVIHAKRG